MTALMAELGEVQTSFITVDPHQFLGIELNPWPANVAELVLWIGYLQWHFRTYGKAAPSEPALRDFKYINNADAVLEWSDRTPRIDENGAPVIRWDGVTTIRHNLTGEEVPTLAARVQVYDYAKPKVTKWPEAEFIVGNPPFIGASRLRDSLGDGYSAPPRRAQQGTRRRRVARPYPLAPPRLPEPHRRTGRIGNNHRNGAWRSRKTRKGPMAQNPPRTDRRRPRGLGRTGRSHPRPNRPRPRIGSETIHGQPGRIGTG